MIQTERQPKSWTGFNFLSLLKLFFGKPRYGKKSLWQKHKGLVENECEKPDFRCSTRLGANATSGLTPGELLHMMPKHDCTFTPDLRWPALTLAKFHQSTVASFTYIIMLKHNARIALGHRKGCSLVENNTEKVVSLHQFCSFGLILFIDNRHCC